MTNVEPFTDTRPNPFPHIVRTPGTLGGAPRIDGTRIGVRHVVVVAAFGDGVAGVLDAYDYLTEAQVNEALAYYDVHRDEVDRDIEEQQILA